MTLNVGRGDRGAPDELAVAPSGVGDALHRHLELGHVLPAAEAEGKGEVARADKDDVDAGRRGDLLRVPQALGILDDGDGQHGVIGEIMVALRGLPADRGEV